MKKISHLDYLIPERMHQVVADRTSVYAVVLQVKDDKREERETFSI